MPVTIQPLTLDQLAAADTIAMRAYQSTTRAEELRRYLRLQPDGWFLAQTEAGAVGLGGAIDYGTFAYIGLISVLPEAQRGGIGRLVMQHILAWLAARDCPRVLLDASPVGQPLYAQLGFVVDDASVVWRRDAAPDVRLPPFAPPAQNVTLYPFTDGVLAEVVAYDAPHFGANRVAALADLLASYPSRAALARDGQGRVSGFAIAQAHNLGPWLADDAATAAALLAFTLALDAPPVGVLVPAQNHAAATLLTSAGFAPQRQLAHMRLGGTPRDRSTHYALASFTLG